ncbi:MAG: exodeoxyribonuclease VII large subunit [bacterium]|nr:exodeoxyribonuclease VII large subunit [bacterium]
MEFVSENGREVPVFSVHDFIEYTNLLIGRKQVVVEGEIGSYNVSQNRWVFFDLKEGDARMSCFGVLYQLPRGLVDGMTVRVTGTPRVHQKSGKFSITVDTVEMMGEGALKKAFELTKKKLQAEGLFDSARKRVLPRFPQTIGIIASRESAAYTDFMRILNQRWGGLDIELFHVKVQGEGAVEDIVNAFAYFNSGQSEAEVIVLTRGGGSMEDLHAFNDEAVARAVFGSRIPVICGVGHERDESLADYVADMRVATPTHAGTLVVPDRDELNRQITHSVQSMSQYIEGSIEWNRNAIQRYMTTLERSATHTLHDFAQLEKRFIFRIESFSQEALHTHTRIQSLTEHVIQAMERSFEQTRQSLDGYTKSLLHLGPEEVLKRGYSIVRRRGSPITSAEALKGGDTIDITFKDGTRQAKALDNQQSLL